MIAPLTTTPAPVARDFTPGRTATTRDLVSRLVVALHDELTTLFTTLDGGGTFTEDPWERPGGGGGVSRTLVEGATFEKAGINRALVDGTLSEEAAARLAARRVGPGATFFAAGVSLVVHPRSPMVPTVHLNVRYFEIANADGGPSDAWVGGGTDLTPTYPFPEDARDFHRALHALCGAHDASLYPCFKRACDEYFVNRHRGNEARGVGGIFFDHLRPGEDPAGLGMAGLLALLGDVGRSPAQAYAPLVERHRHTPWGDAERELQLARRGRYAEFNLLHDRGTHFGLQTGARTDSVLMSLPPLASWAPVVAAPGSSADRLAAMLAPRDWAGEPTADV
ncbi:MAG: oxygen-dependent coproporphyrinogen oxidase [Gemmatirosa sp.]